MPANWRTKTKRIFAAALHHTGALRLLDHVGRDRGVVLAYHRVLPPDSPHLRFTQPGMYVTSTTFERHMRYLRERYHVVALEHLVTERRRARLCAVTFDDGWADNYTYAFPVLTTYAIPATVFLATGLVGTMQWPWVDRLCYYVHALPVPRLMGVLNLELERLGGRAIPMVARPSDKHAAAEEIVRFLKTQDLRVTESILARVAPLVPGPGDPFDGVRPWLTWDEVSEMTRAGIAFGSHTETHSILTQVPIDDARREIQSSRATLAARTGRPVTAFCYPNGGYNRELMQIVEESGYQVAVITKPGTVGRLTSPMAVNRLMLHDDLTSTVATFACVLSHRVPFF